MDGCSYATLAFSVLTLVALLLLRIKLWNQWIKLRPMRHPTWLSSLLSSPFTYVWCPVHQAHHVYLFKNEFLLPQDICTHNVTHHWRREWGIPPGEGGLSQSHLWSVHGPSCRRTRSSSSLHHAVIDQWRHPNPAATYVFLTDTISILVACLLMKQHDQTSRQESHSVILEALVDYQWLQRALQHNIHVFGHLGFLCYPCTSCKYMLWCPPVEWGDYTPSDLTMKYPDLKKHGWKTGF